MSSAPLFTRQRGITVLALWLPLLATLLLSLLAFQGHQLNDLDARHVLHTIQVQDQIKQLDSLVREVETNQRGYLLSSNRMFLALYQEALRGIPEQTDRLTNLIADNPLQVAAVAQLRLIIGTKLALAAQSVTPSGIFLPSPTDEIEPQIHRLAAEENRLLIIRQKVLDEQVKAQRHLLSLLVGADIALVLGLVFLMDRSRRSSRKADVQTERANTRTEQAEARIEQGLRDSELRYRRTFETAQDGILILDGATGQVVDANPIMKVLLGYSQEEIVGRKLWEIGPFKGIAASKLTFAELQNGDRIFYDGLPLETKDGRQLEVEFISSAFLVAQKRLIQCNIRDLTARKQAEHQLLLLRICVSHFNDIVLITEAEPLKGVGRKIVFVNEAFHRITGYAPQEALGRTPQFLQGAKTDPVVVAEIRHALRQYQPIRRQLINYRKDGSEYWMDIDIVPIFDLSGKCTYFSAIQRDITEERKSAESLNLFRSLMDRSPDAIEVIDPDTGRILDVNATGCRRLGYSREEMLKLSLSDIVLSAPGSPPFSMEKSGEEIRQTGFKSFEGLHRRKDRSLFPIEVNVQYIQLNRGYLIAVVRDITERKKLENEFLRAQRMESIGTLAGGIAHDLNNILAPIMIAIEILKLTATDPQAKSILQTIEVSAKRGADIVRQVLSFARGMEGEKRPLQLSVLLRDLETIIKETFPKDILVQFVLPSDLWLILGDSTQINQVLLNLCVNARDAMPGGGRLTVTLENSPSPSARFVSITVADSGTGIDPGIVDKIFDPFFTTKEPNKGTGLGLSTVMTIVKSHGGTINVSSGAGVGTTFVVLLPALDAVPETAAPTNLPPSLPRGNGEKILLVDDEACILIVTAQTLENFGYRVITATDGAEAVAIYAQHRHEIAVVLTDMSMPILDGPATIYALLRINPKIKIIAASGVVERDELKRTPGTTVKHFLKKPYTASALLTVLRAILDHG